MEWLSRWWRELFRDVALTGAGLAIIYSQVVRSVPSPLGPYLIGAGLALTVPSTYAKLREISATGRDGGRGSPLPPPGEEPLPTPSGRAGD